MPLSLHRSVVLELGLVVTACSPSAPPSPIPPPPAAERSAPAHPWAGDYAFGSFATPLPIDDAEAILRRTQVFSVGGMPPKRQIQAFNVLADQPDAHARFEVLSSDVSAVGRLYAFAGLLLLDSSAATDLRGELLEDTMVVQVNDSDTWDRQSVRQLAALIEQRQLGTAFLDAKMKQMRTTLGGDDRSTIWAG